MRTFQPFKCRDRANFVDLAAVFEGRSLLHRTLQLPWQASVSRREVTEPGPRSCRPNSVASEASRISPTVFHPVAVTAFLILVENRTFSMGVSSGSSGAG